jgi:hypothetical protein
LQEMGVRNVPNPHGISGCEASNIYYGPVPQGPTGRVVQPFGLPTPKFTGISPTYDFEGAGLYPNSKLSATAWWSQSGTDESTQITASPSPQSQSDGSFVVNVVSDEFEKLQYQAGTVFVKVSDADGNWVTGSAETPSPPAAWPLRVVTNQSGLRPSPQNTCS